MSRPRTSLPDDSRAGGATLAGAARRRNARSIEAAIQRVFAPHHATPRGARFAGAWRKTLRLLRPLGAVSWGNSVRVLTDGDQAFEALWSEIAAARSSVILTTYILEPDRVGERTLLELERAAERGCRVLLVLDAYGSHRLDDERMERLRRAGATVLLFNPILRWRTRLSRLVRNHRKILVLDRRLAFCGGMNVAEEYAGLRHGTGVFRDTQLELRGPCAQDLAALVESVAAENVAAVDVTEEKRAAQSLARAAGPASAPAPTETGPLAPEGSLVLILESHVRRQRRAIQKALRTTLARAVERCFLTSPYFVPPPRLMRGLVHAARRGVDVRVLTAGISDVPLVRFASQHLYGRLLQSGVRIFELERRVLHAKTVTVDGVYASVGSFNLDYWSDRRNLEVSVSTLDRGAACELEAQFERDLLGAQEVSLESWGRRSLMRRLAGWLAYQLLRI